MKKIAKKISPDPVQQSLRESKDAWNGDVRSFTKEVKELRNQLRLFNSSLIEYKKLINGYPGAYHKEKGDIKYPIPADPNSISTRLSDHFSGLVQKIENLSNTYSNIAQKSSDIVAQQTQYSQTRKKKQANHIDDLLISEGSTPFSRFLSTMNIFNRENWATRKSWLAHCVSLKEYFNNLDYTILGTDKNSIREADAILANDILPKLKLLSSLVNRKYNEEYPEVPSDTGDGKQESFTSTTSENVPPQSRRRKQTTTRDPVASEMVARESTTSESHKTQAPAIDLDLLPEPDLQEAKQEYDICFREYINALSLPNNDPFKVFLKEKQYFRSIFLLQKDIDTNKNIQTYEAFISAWKNIKQEWESLTKTSQLNYELEKYGQHYVGRWLRKLRHDKPVFHTGVDEYSTSRIDISSNIQTIRELLNEMMDSLEQGTDLKLLYDNLNKIKEISDEIRNEDIKPLLGESLTSEQQKDLAKKRENRRLLELARTTI